MAELKYERLIVKMSVEQKVKLVTSLEFYKSSPVGGYEFPVFNIQNQPFDESCKGMRATQFPCDAALACAWNPDLTEKVYAAVGEEAGAVHPFAYYNCTNDLTEEGFTSQPFVLGKFMLGKVGGLRRGGAYVNFEDRLSDDETEEFFRRAVRDEVLASASPSSLILSDLEDADVIKRRFKNDSLTYGVASSVEEALDFFYGGASFVFLSANIQNALINKLTSLTHAYKQAHAKYVNDALPESSFARLVRTFKIFDGGIIDRACDKIIDIIYSMRDAKENPQAVYKTIDGGDGALFDEIGHHDLAVEAARESAVLLKNQSSLLPLNRAVRVGVMGEYAKEVKYARGYYVTDATKHCPVTEVINDYGLQTSGYALGYYKGEVGRSDLLDHASALCSKSDVVILYLSVNKGETTLPPEQLELVRLAAGKNVKVVAVVAAYDTSIDLSFGELCDALLLTYVAGQGGVAASLDIITGEVCPSGKLASAVGVVTPAGFREIYPVGYGLSYTQFEYTNFKANESGVSFTVRNTGNCDGYAVPMLFVKKKNTKSPFAEKLLRGFTKVFVEQGDAVRVKIPFGETTFSQFDKDRGYFTEGGLYNVSIGENFSDEKLSGMLILKDYDEKRSFKNKVMQQTDDGRAVDFSESGLPTDVKAARKKLPFALKVTLAIMLALYADGIMCLFAFGNLIDKTDMIFYAVLATVAVVLNALIVVYVIIAFKHRRSEKYLHPNVVLTEMLDNVEEFTEIAKVRFKTPVDEEKLEEETEEETESKETEAEQQMAATYEVKFDDVETGSVELASKTSFNELCNNLKAFAASKGINLEISSARALTAACAACKLVFVTSKNAELLPRFTGVLSEYFGNENRISASDDWDSLSDILWSQGDEDGTYVLSAFSNAVYGAHVSREQEKTVVIDNVNVNNLGSYFFSFLEFANHPTEEYIINFNEETSFPLPGNLTYVLVPQGGRLDVIPTEILNAAIVVDVMLSPADVVPEEEVAPKAMLHEDYLLLLSEAKEEHFVTERIWKRVDALAEAISANEKFAVGNKNIIQLESFTSVLMGCGADESEAVINMFLSKLGYQLKNTRTYRQNGGDKTVYAMIEKLFGDEELNKIKRFMAKTVQVQEEAQISADGAVSAQDTQNGENIQVSANGAANAANSQDAENTPQTTPNTPENAANSANGAANGAQNAPKTGVNAGETADNGGED